VEDGIAKMSELRGSMKEAVDLKMDELTVLKMKKLMKMLLK
jgi:hypothetical protein